MKPVLPSAQILLTIPFHDVDSMEVVWHGHYAKYFELARCQLLDDIGYSYRAMRASGFAWPVVEMHIKYAQALVFEQQIKVSACIVEWEHRLKIGYRITDVPSGRSLTKGYTVQVALDIAKAELQFESPLILRQKLGLA